MRRRTAARFSVFLLGLHGLIEVAGPIVLIFIPQVRGGLKIGGVEGEHLAESWLMISMMGGIWGLTRLVAGWGIWQGQKWAFMLGIVMSAITMTAAMRIIPAGGVDMIFAAPVLILLIYAWFGQDLSLEKVKLTGD